jgi:N-methylhydantoinase A
VAGRLEPDAFLGGAMRLDREAALAALTRLGERLGVDARSAARGVLRYAVSQMAHALRLVTVRRGLDPRDFALIACGGAGPLHAALLARELGVPRVVVPPGPGHFSAFGMLLGGLASDAVRTSVGPLDLERLDALMRRLEHEARAGLDAQAGRDTAVERYAQLRYRGQEHTLEVAVDRSRTSLADLERRFGDASEQAYALRLDAPLELVAGRVVVRAPSSPLRWLPDSAPAARGRRGSRTVDFDVHGGEVDAAVVQRSGLRAGDSVPGPCIVEEAASTTLVLPAQAVRADEHGNLWIEERE